MRTRYNVRYLMAIRCIGFISNFISFMRGELSSRLMLLVWIAPLTPTKMIMKGLTFQPWVHDAFKKGAYSLCSILMTWLVYLSFVKENLIIWMVRSSEGSSCPSFLNAAPLMYTMSRPHLTRHLQHVLLPLPTQLKTHHVHRTISRIIHKVDYYIWFKSWMGNALWGRNRVFEPQLCKTTRLSLGCRSTTPISTNHGICHFCSYNVVENEALFVLEYLMYNSIKNQKFHHDMLTQYHGMSRISFNWTIESIVSSSHRGYRTPTL